MPGNERIDIMMCFDQKHFIGAGPMITSMIENAERPGDLFIHFTVVHGEESGLLKLIGDHFPNAPFRYEVREFQPSEFLSDYIRAGQPYTYADYPSQVMNFARFHLHDLYPDLDKVIYLDADLIVEGDIAEFWRLATLKEHALAAVTTGDFNTREGRFNPDSELLREFDFSAPAFNNGIYVTSLEAWRKQGLKEALEEWMKKHQEAFDDFVFGTQTLMNLVFYRNYEPLPPEWNLRPLGWFDDIPRDLLDGAKILHWAGSRKPWREDGLYKEYWEKYAQDPNVPAGL